VACCVYLALYFGGAFNKAIIPLALAGYEMTIANLALLRWLSIISYPTRAHGIIVKYITWPFDEQTE